MPASTPNGSAESGFDAPRVEELVQDAEIKQRLLATTQRSVERGSFGSPTFFVGSEIFFGKDRLRGVEELILGQD
jgi:2-hydroxychromene-2-carboxylate isomerase